jgi:hypothetical protein
VGGAVRALVVVLGMMSTAAAVEPAEPVGPISTDRPGQSTSTDIVPRGTLQIEGGMQYQPSSDDRTPDVSIPQLVLRWAPLVWLELRLGSNFGLFTQRTAGSDAATTIDLTVATKMRVIEQRGAVPTVGALVEVDAPIASTGEAINDFDPSLTLLADWDLTAEWSIAANLALAGPSPGVNDVERVFQVSPIVALGWSPTEPLALFAEWYSLVKANDEPTQQSADGGVTWVVTDDFQIDVAAGVGLNAAAPDYYVGAGFAWRWWLP